MWQKCPICDGTGKLQGLLNSTCTVCGGMKIIDEVTGKPPKHDGDMCPHDSTKIKFC